MTETIQTAVSGALTGVALLTSEPPTWLRTASARVAAEDMPRVRAAVDAARANALDAVDGTWVDVLVVWGRPGKRPLPEALTVRPADVESLRGLLLELDR